MHEEIEEGAGMYAEIEENLGEEMRGKTAKRKEKNLNSNEEKDS